MVSKRQRDKRKARPANQKPLVSRPEPKIVPDKPDTMTLDTGKISSVQKRITFTVSEELHKKAFLLVCRQGTTVKDLLTDFLEKATVNEEI